MASEKRSRYACDRDRLLHNLALRIDQAQLTVVRFPRSIGSDQAEEIRGKNAKRLDLFRKAGERPLVQVDRAPRRVDVLGQRASQLGAVMCRER